MATFTITITDKSSLAGITKAREAYNNTLTLQKDKDGKELPITSHPDYLKTDQDYVQFVMASAAESYGKQYNV